MSTVDVMPHVSRIPGGFAPIVTELHRSAEGRLTIPLYSGFSAVNDAFALAESLGWRVVSPDEFHETGDYAGIEYATFKLVRENA